jgi:hypothetical protein
VQVRGKLVHHPTGHSLAAHRATVAVQGASLFHQLSGTCRIRGRPDDSREHSGICPLRLDLCGFYAEDDRICTPTGALRRT